MSLDRVRTALSERQARAIPLSTDRPAELTAAANHRRAAVLVPLFEDTGELRVLLTRRSTTVRTHRGDVALPGGLQEPGEDPVATALREAVEEIGLDPTSVEVLGELDRLTTVVSGYEIIPIVGTLRGRPVTMANRHEVARIFDVALTELLDDGVYRQELWDVHGAGAGADAGAGGPRAIHLFELEGETVWGATARILYQLLCLLVGVPSEPS